jgi:hypothetical protein
MSDRVLSEYEQMLMASLRTMAEGFEYFEPDHKLYSRERYVLTNGRLWIPQPYPKRYKRGVPKYCFANARALAKRNKKLRYVEGFAYPAQPFFPVSHAWCVDQQDRVIDNTWRGDGTAYCGVHFDMKFVEEYTRGTDCASVLDNWQAGFKILRKPKEAS